MFRALLLLLAALVVGLFMPKAERHEHESGYDRMTPKEHEESAAWWTKCLGDEDK